MSSVTLNPAQKKAVEHKNGPLLIIAGAGTGKTRVITQRILWLIEQKLAKSDEILALTFTQKAAQEMEERVDETMPYGYEPMWISTFHSFADSIMKQEAVYIGLDPGYVLMSQAQEYVFFRSHLFDFSLDRFRPHGNPTKFIREILSHFSRLGDEDVSPDDYTAFVKKSKNLQPEEKADLTELATVYTEYSDLKERESRLGFYDLVPLALKLFRSRPRVLKRYQDKFRFILVDEFQDTNYAQNELVCLLAGKRGNITVVGDDDQSIYKFRGAAVSNILDFKKRFPSCEKVVLTKNYRSNQEILDTAYKLVRHNDPDRLEVTEGVDKKLVSARTLSEAKTSVTSRGKSRTKDQLGILGGEESVSPNLSVRRIHETNDLAEAEAIALEIERLVKTEKKYSPSSIAILVRAHDHASEIVKSLRYHGIPFRYLGSKGLYARPEVKDLIAMLTLLVDPHDDAALFRLLMLKPKTVTVREYVELQRLARRKRLSVLELLEELLSRKIGSEKSEKQMKSGKGRSDGKDGPHAEKSFSSESFEEAPRGDLSVLKDRFLSGKSQTWIVEIFDVLDYSLAQVSEDMPVGRVLYDMAEKLGYLERYTKEQTVEDEWKAQNIGAYFKTLQRFERENDHPGVREYVDYLDYSIEIGEDPQVEEEQMLEYEGVNISTIHGAKGLEFPVVFLVDLVSERFPTRRRGEVLPIPDELVKERLPEGDAHIQEERRLCYVGMTRAQDILYLTSADYYAQGVRKKKQSVFLEDVDMVVKPVETKSPRAKVDIKRIAEGDDTGTVDIPDDMRKTFLARVEKNLSYSHLSSYENCPYQFYFKYFLEIPGKPSASRSFGLSVHNTLREFYERVMRSKSGLEGFEKMPDLEDMLEIFRQKWQSDGYENRVQENRRFNAGKKAMLSYYETIFSPKDDPVQLEGHFRAHLGDVRLKGVVDRIDKVDGGVWIFDYKTGAVPKNEREVKNDLQLPVYVMAIEQTRGEKVLGAEYVYIEHGKRIQVEISPKMREKAISEVLRNLKSLRTMTFPAKPGTLCRFCDYSAICDYAMMG